MVLHQLVDFRRNPVIRNVLDRVAAKKHEVKVVSAIILQIPCVIAVRGGSVSELMTPYTLVGNVFPADIFYECNAPVRNFRPP